MLEEFLNVHTYYIKDELIILKSHIKIFKNYQKFEVYVNKK